MSTIIYFTLPPKDGKIPVCVLEDEEVLGWTYAMNPNDVEYCVWDFVEKREESA